MELPNLEVYKSKTGPLLSSLAFIGYALYMYVEKGESLFTLTPFIPNGLLAIAFFGLIIGGLLVLLKYRERVPVLVINSSGISLEVSKVFTSKTEMIPWENIYYYYINVQQRPDYVTFYSIIIKLKEPEEEREIKVGGLDISVDQIAEVIEPYSKKYNFFCLTN